MNKTILNIALAASAMLASSAAMASDGIITFTGEIQATTCAVLPGVGTGTGPGINVNMGTQNASGLSKPGATGTRRSFSLKLDEADAACSSNTGKVAEFIFGGDIDLSNGYLNTSVKNLQIRILHDHKPVHLQHETIDAGEYNTGAGFELPLVAEYYALDKVDTGGMSADLEYTLNFN